MAKRQHKHYTDDERATYVAMLVAEGYPERRGALKKVAAFVGCHPNVLRRWWKGTNNPPPTKLVAQKKADIATRIEEVLHHILDLLPGALETAEPRDLIIGLGVAVDKLQLLHGKPTERVEEHLTVADSRERLAQLLDRRAAAYRAERDTGGPH